VLEMHHPLQDDKVSSTACQAVASWMDTPEASSAAPSNPANLFQADNLLIAPEGPADKSAFIIDSCVGYTAQRRQCPVLTPPPSPPSRCCTAAL
jgi:hypothetical protein